MNEDENNLSEENKISNIQPSDGTDEAKYSDELTNPISTKKSAWFYVFIVLGVLQSLGVTIFFSVLLWLDHLTKSGNSGTEYVALYMFVTLIPIVVIISLINLISIPIYKSKHKNEKNRRLSAIFILSVIILCAICVWLANLMRVLSNS